jgi:hypothetical protein
MGDLEDGLGEQPELPIFLPVTLLGYGWHEETRTRLGQAELAPRRGKTSRGLVDQVVEGTDEVTLLGRLVLCVLL